MRTCKTGKNVILRNVQQLQRILRRVSLCWSIKKLRLFDKVRISLVKGCCGGLEALEIDDSLAASLFCLKVHQVSAKSLTYVKEPVPQEHWVPGPTVDPGDDEMSAGHLQRIADEANRSILLTRYLNLR